MTTVKLTWSNGQITHVSINATPAEALSYYRRFKTTEEDEATGKETIFTVVSAQVVE